MINISIENEIDYCVPRFHYMIPVRVLIVWHHFFITKHTGLFLLVGQQFQPYRYDSKFLIYCLYIMYEMLRNTENELPVYSVLYSYLIRWY